MTHLHEMLPLQRGTQIKCCQFKRQRRGQNPVCSASLLSCTLTMIIATTIVQPSASLPFQKGSSVPCQGTQVNMIDHFPDQPHLNDCIKCDCKAGIVDNCRRIDNCNIITPAINQVSALQISSQDTSRTGKQSSNSHRHNHSNQANNQPKGPPFARPPQGSSTLAKQSQHSSKKSSRVDTDEQNGITEPSSTAGMLDLAPTTTALRHKHPHYATGPVSVRAPAPQATSMSKTIKIGSSITFGFVPSPQNDTNSNANIDDRHLEIASSVLGPNWREKMDRNLNKLASRTSTTTTTSTTSTTTSTTTTTTPEPYYTDEPSDEVDDEDSSEPNIYEGDATTQSNTISSEAESTTTTATNITTETSTEASNELATTSTTTSTVPIESSGPMKPAVGELPTSNETSHYPRGPIDIVIPTSIQPFDYIANPANNNLNDFDSLSNNNNNNNNNNNSVSLISSLKNKHSGGSPAIEMDHSSLASNDTIFHIAIGIELFVISFILALAACFRYRDLRFAAEQHQSLASSGSSVSSGSSRSSRDCCSESRNGISRSASTSATSICTPSCNSMPLPNAVRVLPRRPDEQMSQMPIQMASNSNSNPNPNPSKGHRRLANCVAQRNSDCSYAIGNLHESHGHHVSRVVVSRGQPARVFNWLLGSNSQQHQHPPTGPTSAVLAGAESKQQHPLTFHRQSQSQVSETSSRSSYLIQLDRKTPGASSSSGGSAASSQQNLFTMCHSSLTLAKGKK